MAAGYAHGTTPAAMHFRTGPVPLASGPPPTFALEPNYACGQHLVYLGGTVLVGDAFSLLSH